MTNRFNALTVRGGFLIIAGAAFIAIGPNILSLYTTGLFAVVALWALAALGLSILLSFTGQLSIAHGAFFALGAYTSAILEERAGFSYLSTLAVAAALTFVGGGLLALPAARVRGLHFAIFTLAFGAFVLWALNHFGSVTGGSGGIVLLDTTALGVSLSDSAVAFRVAVGVLVIGMLGFMGLRASHTGRRWMLAKSSPIVAEAYGVNLLVATSLAFALSALYAGVAGSLYAANAGIIGTQFVNLFTAVNLIAMVIVGGTGSAVGPLLGAAFVVMVPTYIQGAADWYPVLTGVFLTIVVLVAPGGLASMPRVLFRMIGRALGSAPVGLRMDRPARESPATRAESP